MIGKDKTDSPIEKLFYDALNDWIVTEHDKCIDIECQQQIGRYRPDFTFWFGTDLVLVVECDGHDFHERTKEQAIRDKSRDRWFLAELGVPTVRFTGREIHSSADECAEEALCIAHSMAARIAYEEWLTELRKSEGDA